MIRYVSLFKKSNYNVLEAFIASRGSAEKVCVNSYYVPLRVEALKGSSVGICSVVGFPLRARFSEAKACEAKLAFSPTKKK